MVIKSFPKYKKIAISGATGAGKSSLAKQLQAILNIPHCEIDELYFDKNWTKKTDFLKSLNQIVEQNAWIIDSLSHRQSIEIILDKADVVLWLDYSRLSIMSRVILRTLKRMIKKENVCASNQENWRNLFSIKHPIFAAWIDYKKHKDDNFKATLLLHHIKYIRLKSPAETRQLVLDINNIIKT